MVESDSKETRTGFAIGNEVQYTRPVSLHLIKSLPFRVGDKTVIRITGFSEPIPIEHLTLEDEQK